MSGNNTKIKYLRVDDKIYEITNLSFFYMSITAVETLLPAASLPEEEIWDLNFFGDYKIKLINNGGQSKIINFFDYKSKNH